MTKGKKGNGANSDRKAKKVTSKAERESANANGFQLLEKVDNQDGSGDSNVPDDKDDHGDQGEKDDQEDSDNQEDEESDEEEKEDGGEVMIPFSQMQRMMDMMMDRWTKANSQPKQAASTVPNPSTKGLPALEKLRNFKGETDTDELDTWLKELRRHCTYYEVGGSLDTEEKKLAYAVSHLVGGAEAWWETQKIVIRTYTDFVKAINRRFRSEVDADKAAEELYELRQKEGQSVTAFSDRFMQLLTRVPTMHEDDKMRLFRRGLVANLQQKVKEHKLRSLNEVVELAIRLESTFAKKTGGSGGTNKAGINSVGGETLPMDPLLELINQIKGWRKETTAHPPAASSTSTGPGGVKEFCARCGSKDHKLEACKYTEWVCFFCKKPGHKKQDCEALKAKLAGSKK